MAQLYDSRRRLAPVPPLFDEAGALPLPSELDLADRRNLAVAQLASLLALLRPRLSADEVKATAQADKTTPRPVVFDPAPFKTAVQKLHIAILDDLAGDPRLLSAYQLGLELNDTCWTPADDGGPDPLIQMFGRNRMAELEQRLTGAAAVLPESSAAAVARSLGYWREWVDANASTLRSGDGNRWARPAGPVLRALQAQGTAWCNVLAGGLYPAGQPGARAWLLAVSSMARFAGLVARRVLRLYWPFAAIAIAALGGLYYLAVSGLRGAAQGWAAAGGAAALSGLIMVGLAYGVPRIAGGIVTQAWNAAKLDALGWTVTTLPSGPVTSRGSARKRGMVAVRRLRPLWKVVIAAAGLAVSGAGGAVAALESGSVALESTGIAVGALGLVAATAVVGLSDLGRERDVRLTTLLPLGARVRIEESVWELAVRPHADRKAWPHLDAPPAVLAGRVFPVTVGLSDSQDLGLVTSSGMLTLPDGDFTLGVELIIDGFGVVSDGDAGASRFFTLDVTATNPYPKRKINLVASDDPALDEHRHISVVFRVGKEMRGFAVRDIVVTSTEAALATVPEAKTSPGFGGIDISPFTVPEAADLTILIKRGDASDGSRLVWSVASPHLDIELPEDNAGPVLGSSAEKFLTELINEASKKSDLLELFSSLSGRGKNQIAPLMPEFVRDALYDVARAVSRPPTILLLSEDPYVPWELAVLQPPLPGWPAGGSPFLGAQAVIGRWVLAAKPPPRFDPVKSVKQVEAEAIISGVYEEVPDFQRLESAEHEAAELQKRWPQSRPVDASFRSVYACLKGDPPADIIHFALHGEFSTLSPSQGLVLIGTEEGHTDRKRAVYLTPDQVGDGELAREPLVFLNACQVGAGRVVLSTYSGMASGFLAAGASAVVAPFWSVNDVVASEVALDFYAQVLDDGERPAEVLRAYRAGVTEAAAIGGDHTVSGTHLAYQFFGHPNLRLAQKA